MVLVMMVVVLVLVVLMVVMVVLVMAVVIMVVLVVMMYSNTEWIPSVCQVLCNTYQVMTWADLTLTLSSIHIGLVDLRLYRSFVPASEPDLCHSLLIGGYALEQEGMYQSWTHSR